MAHALTPNSPMSRLRYIIEQYEGTKQQGILPDVIFAALYAMGHDAAARNLEDGPPPIFDHWAATYPGDLGVLAEREYDYERKALLHWLGQQLAPSHPVDFVLPWAAQQLSRRWKAVDSAHRQYEAGYLDPTDVEDAQRSYIDAVDVLNRKLGIVAVWAEQESVNLNQTSLVEAMRAVQDFDAPDVKVPRGTVVYEFDDGWTIQRLVEREAVLAEGEAVQNCLRWGEFCEPVELRESFIFSLRDPAGKPHVSAEWIPDFKSFGHHSQIVKFLDEQLGTAGASGRIPDVRIPDDIRDVSSMGEFTQILGKQNEPPRAKYRPYIQQWIIDAFGGDPLGLLMVYTPDLGQLSLEGRTLRNVDLGQLASELYEEDIRLDGVLDFTGATLINCQLIFPDFEMEQVSFEDTVFDRCRLYGQFAGCDFSGATFDAGSFEGAFLECLFLHTKFKGPRGANATFTRCDLRGAIMSHADFLFVNFADCDMRHVKFIDPGGTGRFDVGFLYGDYDGMTFEAVTSWMSMRIVLDNADFRSVQVRNVHGVPRSKLKEKLRDVVHMKAGSGFYEGEPLLFADEAYRGPRW